MGPFIKAPNSAVFSGLLGEAGENVAKTTHELDRLMHGWPDGDGMRGEIKQLEEEGDRITHDVMHELHATAVTPIDREDIHSLASALDDVVDLAEEVADFLGLYMIEAPMEQATELTGVLRDAGREIAAALADLGDMEAIVAHAKRIETLEDEGDRINRHALVSLFSGGIDPMVVIRWKDIYERLEGAIDACEHVAHILEGIAVKHA